MCNATDVLLNNIARWQLERDSGSLLLSLCYDFFQLSLGTMHRADRDARLRRDRAQAQASGQQWRNFGPSAMFDVARSRRRESVLVGAHEFIIAQKARRVPECRIEKMISR
jgi:hypothetical protein